MFSKALFFATQLAATMTLACKLTPQSQVVDVVPGDQAPIQFYVSYKNCGAPSTQGKDIVCELKPDEYGRVGGAFVDAVDPEGSFAATDIHASGRKVTFRGYKGSPAQGDVHLVVHMSLAPSRAVCDFVGKKSEVHFVESPVESSSPTPGPTALPTLAPTFAPTPSPTTFAPTFAPTPGPTTFAPTPSPTTPQPTLAPTEQCPCYADTSDGGLLFKGLVDGTMDQSDIDYCSWNDDGSGGIRINVRLASGGFLFGNNWPVGLPVSNNAGQCGYNRGGWRLILDTDWETGIRCRKMLTDSLNKNYNWNGGGSFKSMCAYSP